MKKIKLTQKQAVWQLLQWPMVCTLGLVALALGCLGFWQQSQTHNQNKTCLDCLYLTLQLFLISVNEWSNPLNWELQVARFLAPAVAAYTAAQALLVIFKEQIQMLRLRFLHGHVVICGLGRKGFRLARDLRDKGLSVLIIERDGENDMLRRTEEIGCFVLIGEATDDDFLRQARLMDADRLIPVCGDDGTNVEVAVWAYQLKHAVHEGARRVLHCHVHIVDRDLRNLFKRHRVFTDSDDQFKVRLFNTYECSARLMLRKHPLDRERIAPDDPRRVRLAVIGFGQMGESIVLQAAKMGHFANGRPMQIMVIDQQVQQIEQGLRWRYPQFDHVCDLGFLQRDADDPEILAQIRAWCEDPAALTTIAICFDEDARCLSHALKLLPIARPRGVPILLRMSKDGGLATLLRSGQDGSSLSALVHPFGMIDLSSSEEILLQEKTDRVAMAVHKDYVALRTKEGVRHETDPALRPWNELDEDLKDSNRQQADHIPVKLRAIGCFNPITTTASAALTTFNSDQVEIMARMEHERWCAERFLAGWTHAPVPKSIEQKTSPHLVPWNQLPEEIRAYDREAVRNLPALFAVTD